MGTRHGADRRGGGALEPSSSSPLGSRDWTESCSLLLGWGGTFRGFPDDGPSSAHPSVLKKARSHSGGGNAPGTGSKGSCARAKAAWEEGRGWEGRAAGSGREGRPAGEGAGRGGVRDPAAWKAPRRKQRAPEIGANGGGRSSRDAGPAPRSLVHCAWKRGPLGTAWARTSFHALGWGVPVQGPKGLRASLDDARRGGGRGKPGGAGWVAESVPDCESPRPLRAEIEGS